MPVDDLPLATFLAKDVGNAERTSFNRAAICKPRGVVLADGIRQVAAGRGEPGESRRHPAGDPGLLVRFGPAWPPRPASSHGIMC
jgi:hypothetical protein